MSRSPHQRREPSGPRRLLPSAWPTTPATTPSLDDGARTRTDGCPASCRARSHDADRSARQTTRAPETTRAATTTRRRSCRWNSPRSVSSRRVRCRCRGVRSTARRSMWWCAPLRSVARLRANRCIRPSRRRSSSCKRPRVRYTDVAEAVEGVPITAARIVSSRSMGHGPSDRLEPVRAGQPASVRVAGIVAARGRVIRSLAGSSVGRTPDFGSGGRRFETCPASYQVFCI